MVQVSAPLNRTMGWPPELISILFCGRNRATTLMLFAPLDILAVVRFPRLVVVRFPRRTAQYHEGGRPSVWRGVRGRKQQGAEGPKRSLVGLRSRGLGLVLVSGRERGAAHEESECRGGEGRDGVGNGVSKRYYQNSRWGVKTQPGGVRGQGRRRRWDDTGWKGCFYDAGAIWQQR